LFIITALSVQLAEALNKTNNGEVPKFENLRTKVAETIQKLRQTITELEESYAV